MENGVYAGYPMIDMLVAVYDGSFHDVDSSEIAFKIAGSMALQSGAHKAGLALLEPIMKVEVATPDEFMGEVIGDLSSKRAQILNTTLRGTKRIITALVPLAELSRYATILRSLTQGRAVSYIEPSHYEEVPNQIAQAIVEKNKPQQKAN
jgi:elongation factor G